MRRLFVVIIMFLSISGASLVVPTTVLAAVDTACDGSSSFLGFPTWYKYLDVGASEDGSEQCAILGPSAGDDELDWPAVIGRVSIAVIEILLRFASIIALGFVIYGGFRYITSQGESENTKSARQTIQNALIGLVVSLIATGAVAFIANQFTS